MLVDVSSVILTTQGSINWNDRLNCNDDVYSALAGGRMYVKRYFGNDN